MNLRLVSQILDKHPQLRLITAHTAELGLELASEHHPDLILLDINLPDMDGYQMLSVLRSQDWAKMMPLIAISANPCLAILNMVKRKVLLITSQAYRSDTLSCSGEWAV